MANRKKKTTTQLGKQPPRYRSFLNPYEDMRFTRCPQCDNKMHQQKLPLVIHVDPIRSTRHAATILIVIRLLLTRTTWNTFLPPFSPSKSRKSLAMIIWYSERWTSQYGSAGRSNR